MKENTDFIEMTKNDQIQSSGGRYFIGGYYYWAEIIHEVVESWFD